MQRRDLLQSGALAGIALLSDRAFAQSGAAGEKLIPWSDQPPPVPPPLENVIKGLTRWEDLDSWITPNDKFFSIAHYNRPAIDAKAWRLDVSGHVGQPDHTDTRPVEGAATAGSHLHHRVLRQQRASVSSPVRSATHDGPARRWPTCCRNAGIKSRRPRSGLLRRRQGEEVVRKDTPLEFKYTSNFARSMSIADAMNPANLLCYEMNGAPLPAANGFPVPSDRARLVWRRQRQVAHSHRGARHTLPRSLHGPRLRDHPRGAARRRDRSWQRHPSAACC